MYSHTRLPTYRLSFKQVATFQQNGENANSSSNFSMRVHLFSLKWTSSSNNDNGVFSKELAETWRWKDAVLGDGRDFFIPKPKTLRALQSYLLHRIPQAQECVVLSNCARFEIFLVTTHVFETSVLLQQLSNAITRQVFYYRSRNHRALDSVRVSMDWPSLIDTTCTNLPAANDCCLLIQPHHWTHVHDNQLVLRHWCFVAAGLATRPNRPDRAVVFQPFSSRDAHILLQLKRTLETVATRQSATSKVSLSSSSSMLAELIRYALRAGKAVRNPNRLRELSLLQKYGTGDSKYSAKPPIEVSRLVQEAAIRLVIDPLVEEAMNKWEAASSFNVTDTIRSFRNEAERLGQTNVTKLAWIRKQIHKPTLMLRQGQSVDIPRVLFELKQHINQSCST